MPRISVMIRSSFLRDILHRQPTDLRSPACRDRGSAYRTWRSDAAARPKKVSQCSSLLSVGRDRAFFVKTAVGASHCRGAKVRARPGRGALPHYPTEGIVPHQADASRRERAGVAALYEESVLAVGHYFRNTAHCARHDRCATGHGLDHAQRDPLVPRGIEVQVEALVVGKRIRSRRQEFNTVTEVQGGGAPC